MINEEMVVMSTFEKICVEINCDIGAVVEFTGLEEEEKMIHVEGISRIEMV